MITGIEIFGFRALQRMDLRPLGRINLFVGSNNSGKTSLLEAIHLVASSNDPAALWASMIRRGEVLFDESVTPGPETEVDVCHLFHGHRLALGEAFHVDVERTSGAATYRAEIVASEEDPELPFSDIDVVDKPVALQLANGMPKPRLFPLTRRGGLIVERFGRRVTSRQSAMRDRNRVQYITSESLDPDELTRLWDQIALTDHENDALETLRLIDDQIDRVAPVSAPFYYRRSRGGFRVKLKNVKQPVPIGSFGDGIWRTLALAVSVARARRGVLIVDEIDTGLHYKVMSDLWRMLDVASRRWNVQVFATTHSYDCVSSLARICRDKESTDIMIHRVERGRNKTVTFDESQIVAAAEYGIEVR